MVFKTKAITGISYIEDVLDKNNIQYAYVSNTNVTLIGRDYEVPNGIPIVYIQSGGNEGFFLEIGRLDGSFNLQDEYTIRFNCSLEIVQKAQTILNKLLIK